MTSRQGQCLLARLQRQLCFLLYKHVKFALIQPETTTTRAVIDLDTVSLHGLKGTSAQWT
jgi:hypothetical protein